jgi:hypothetical protein
VVFLSALEVVFLQQPSRYSTDDSKIYLTISLLEGQALLWATPLVENRNSHSVLFSSWSEFRTRLQLHFSSKLTFFQAEMDIRTLRQGSRSIAQHIAEFQLLAADLE